MKISLIVLVALFSNVEGVKFINQAQVESLNSKFTEEAQKATKITDDVLNKIIADNIKTLNTLNGTGPSVDALAKDTQMRALEGELARRIIYGNRGSRVWNYSNPVVNGLYYPGASGAALRNFNDAIVNFEYANSIKAIRNQSVVNALKIIENSGKYNALGIDETIPHYQNNVQTQDIGAVAAAAYESAIAEPVSPQFEEQQNFGAMQNQAPVLSPYGYSENYYPGYPPVPTQSVHYPAPVYPPTVRSPVSPNIYPAPYATPYGPLGMNYRPPFAYEPTLPFRSTYGPPRPSYSDVVAQAEAAGAVQAAVNGVIQNNVANAAANVLGEFRTATTPRAPAVPSREPAIQKKKSAVNAKK